MEPFRARLATASDQHANPKLSFTYGTAGFRMLATSLDGVVFRVALVAALRSASLGGKSVGVMITASHNPEKDNGVKIVDPTGEMLVSNWEGHATAVANASTADDIIRALDDICNAEGIGVGEDWQSRVIYGHDTRPSCPSLVKATEDGLAALDCHGRNAGLVTTPQLHFLVAETNSRQGIPSLDDYYEQLATSFASLNGTDKLPGKLIVDCANGVGAPKMVDLQRRLPQLDLCLANDRVGQAGALNSGCGADFVKTRQRAPEGSELEANVRYCSFDGDADRIVYYYRSHDGRFALLDGDKIASLIAAYLQDLSAKSGLVLSLGIVQTAYANGASTAYIKNVLRVPVACVPTGVKHLHHAAKDFDIGVYFEANGHGTVVFSPETTSKLEAKAATSEPARVLLETSRLINQTVGDAMSDMLLIETILARRNWSLSDWDAMYTDLPNRLVKVIVKDRAAFVTTDAERRLVQPDGLQSRIDDVAAKYKRGRSFVRPSGTEDCVRVYAEASTRDDADALAHEVATLVFDLAGSGTRPDRFE